nr:hypothetical protein pPsy0462a_00060 [Pseudomonas syringae]
MTQTFGNPVRAWASTLVASSKGSGPHLLYPPLSEALNLLPLTRPASAWQEDGNALFSTLDGKLYPVGLATTQQNKLTSVVCGSSGLGKSVLLNKLGNVMVSSAQQRLPFMAGGGQRLLDARSSRLATRQSAAGAQGRGRGDRAAEQCSALPEPVRYPAGRTLPIAPERNWIISMLTAMCIDPSTGNPPNERDTRQILDRIISMAYTANAEISPRPWAHGVVPEVDTALDKSGFDRTLSGPVVGQQHLV